MTPEGTGSKRSKVFYGWIALVGVCLVIFIVGGSFVHSFGVLLPKITAEFDWNRSSISSAFFLNMTLYALSLTIVGRFYDR